MNKQIERHREGDREKRDIHKFESKLRIHVRLPYVQFIDTILAHGLKCPTNSSKTKIFLANTSNTLPQPGEYMNMTACHKKEITELQQK